VGVVKTDVVKTGVVKTDDKPVGELVVKTG
jgi:hypothetical protein